MEVLCDTVLCRDIATTPAIWRGLVFCLVAWLMKGAIREALDFNAVAIRMETFVLFNHVILNT